MWIITTEGFLSAVKDRTDPKLVRVRARTERHITQFAEEIQALMDGKPDQIGPDQIVDMEDQDGNYDYRWVLTVPKDIWGDYLLTVELPDSHVKEHVSRIGTSNPDNDLYDAVLDIWTRMYRLQSGVKPVKGGPLRLPRLGGDMPLWTEDQIEIEVDTGNGDADWFVMSENEFYDIAAGNTATLRRVADMFAVTTTALMDAVTGRKLKTNVTPLQRDPYAASLDGLFPPTRPTALRPKPANPFVTAALDVHAAVEAAREQADTPDANKRLVVEMTDGEIVFIDVEYDPSESDEWYETKVLPAVKAKGFDTDFIDDFYPADEDDSEDGWSPRKG